MLSQAVILCGGLGTRLGKLTSDAPKPLLPVSGRPFLDHLIQEVARYDVRRITLIAGRFGEMIATAYDGRRIHGAQIEAQIEREPAGTAGALRFAAERLAGEFLLMNGDSWIDADLVGVVRAWEAARSEDPAVLVQLLLQHAPDAGRFGAVSLSVPGSKAGKVAAFREKSTSTAGMPGWINAGVYVLDRALIQKIPALGPASLEIDVLPALAAQGLVCGVAAKKGSYFIDIGVPEAFERAQAEVPRHRTRPALFLDCDSALNVDRGGAPKVEGLEWRAEAREAIAFANGRGWFVFVVANQAGVAQGHYDVERFHAAMQADLWAVGGHVDAFGGPSGRRRAPDPGLIEDLLAEWPVDRSRSLMIGDQESDMQAAAASGLRGVLYKRGSLLDLLRAVMGEGRDVDQ